MLAYALERAADARSKRWSKGRGEGKMKHPRWESNPDLQIRSLPFYPLNYEGVWGFYYKTSIH